MGGLAVVGIGTNAVLATPETVDGTVEAKSITGRGGDESHTVMAHEGTLTVDDSAYEDEFTDWRDVTVDDALARRFGTDYEEVFYNLHVSHETANDRQNVAAGETLAYRTDRAVFNEVQVGDEVAFSPSGGDVPHIDSLD